MVSVVKQGSCIYIWAITDHSRDPSTGGTALHKGLASFIRVHVINIDQTHEYSPSVLFTIVVDVAKYPDAADATIGKYI